MKDQFRQRDRYKKRKERTGVYYIGIVLAERIEQLLI